MRAFLMLYANDVDGTDRRAFILLASVCSDWRQTLTGWPQSPTSRWVRHQLKKCEYSKLTQYIDVIDFRQIFAKLNSCGEVPESFMAYLSL